MSSPSTPSVGAPPLSNFRRRISFALVLAVTVGASLVFSLLPPLLPALALHFGGGREGEMSAQLALSMPSLGWLFGGAVSGFVLGRVGMRPTVIGAILAVGAIGAAAGLLSDVVAFAAARFALGFAGSFMLTGAYTILADIYDDKDRPKMIGFQKATASLSAVPVGLAAGALASAFDWRAPFALYAVFGVLGAVLAFFAIPATASAAAALKPKAKMERADFARLWPILVLIFFLQIMMMMGVAQLPFVLAEHGFGSASTLSVVLALAALLMSVGAVLSGYLQTRFSPWKVLCVGLALAASGYVAVGVAPNGYVVAAANGIALVGCGLFFPQYLTLPLARVSVAARPATIGLIQVAMYLGAFMNPFLLAPLRASFGHSGTYLAVGIIVLLTLASAVAIASVRRGGRLRPAPASGS